jgi:SAM-dependent methyltransferase
MPDYYLRTRCRMCDGNRLQKVMTLTPTPPGNNFLRADQLGQAEPRYPLELHLCGDCSHVQLGHVVDPRILYQNSYGYVSGTSPKFVEHLRNYAADVIDRFRLQPGALVADIGSNDGTCLRFFAEAGMRVVGVDPAQDIARRATESGIPTVCDFFSEELGQRLHAEHGPAAFITSHNACAHIDRLDGVLQGVRRWLTDDGVFGCEVGYLLDVYENTWFDTIYHEHLDYHTVGPFEPLLRRVGMEPIRVERVSPQGGSLRVFAQKIGQSRPRDETFAGLRELERQREIHRPETFERFGQRIGAIGAELKTLLAGLKAQGRSIAGYGAPTKSTTLLNHFRLGRAELDFIVDDNPLKHGLFSPVTHIPVFPTQELYERRPDYVLILAWNFADPIMTAHRRFSEEGGRFIVPMPVPRIVE